MRRELESEMWAGGTRQGDITGRGHNSWDILAGSVGSMWSAQPPIPLLLLLGALVSPALADAGGEEHGERSARRVRRVNLVQHTVGAEEH